MSLLDVLRSGIATADKVTKPLQPTVGFQKGFVDNRTGTKSLGPVQNLQAIVDWRQRQLRGPGGITVVVRCTVLFLNPSELLAATGGGLVTTNDRITLPDGTTGPIMDTAGFMDAGTGQPLTTEVAIG